MKQINADVASCPVETEGHIRSNIKCKKRDEVMCSVQNLTKQCDPGIEAGVSLTHFWKFHWELNRIFCLNISKTF